MPVRRCSGAGPTGWATRDIFDYQHAVADAGLLLTGSLVDRLGLEQFTENTVPLGFQLGRELLTLAHTLVAGGGSPAIPTR